MPPTGLVLTGPERAKAKISKNLRISVDSDFESAILRIPRIQAGPISSAESVFFSGPVSQFSAVYDCLRLGFAVYAKDDL